MTKPLAEDVLVCAFKDRVETIALRADGAAALELVRDIESVIGKVELRLVIDPNAKAPPERESDGRAVLLASKYPGRCKACGKPYAAGDSIRWLKGVGCFCVGCKPKP